jgi:hypothetical protein
MQESAMVEESPDTGEASGKAKAARGSSGDGKRTPRKTTAAKASDKPAEQTTAGEPAGRAGTVEPADADQTPQKTQQPEDADGPKPALAGIPEGKAADAAQGDPATAEPAFDPLRAVPAARLDPPVAPTPPPTQTFLGAAVTTAAHPHSHHHGFYDGDSGEPIDELSDAFEQVPGMATMTRTTRRIVERHRVPNTKDAMTDRLLFARGVQVPQAVAEALVATAKVVKPK